jgi:FkbM family methyltransferase
MSWRTLPIVVKARNLLRKLGLSRLVGRLVSRRGYEVSFDRSFRELLTPGDCVWDIGANIGHYTREFSHAVGPEGLVCAFEPNPDTFARLERACSDLTNVRLFPCGLGERESMVAFQPSDDRNAAASRVVEPGEGESEVTIRSAKSVLAEPGVRPPNAIKIDVEGMEKEVLLGFGDLLRASSVRGIGVEVHFAVLEARGRNTVPYEIERLLREQGYRVSWCDYSHLVARRQ